MKEKILIIDDDRKLNDLLKDFLTPFGYSVTSITHPRDGLNQIRISPPDIIILDIMLPEIDGFEMCRTIRKESDVPIIMLTARGDVTDRIVGLELGADDYLPKPFEPRELVARIQSVLRRIGGNRKAAIMQAGGLAVDTKKREAILDKKPLELTTMEFEVLVYFMRNTGIVLNRDQIIEKLRGLDWDSFDRSIDVLISRLRNKLGDDPKDPTYIKTIWGHGYMFMGGAQ